MSGTGTPRNGAPTSTTLWAQLLQGLHWGGVEQKVYRGKIIMLGHIDSKDFRRSFKEGSGDQKRRSVNKD